MRKKNIHYFQHVPYEDLGCIAAWAKENQYLISSTKFYHNDSLPELDEIDWLIIMGGPMNAYDEEKYPWLGEEKRYISKAIESGKVVLGICLGSQLLADVLGANVYPNKEKEIGFYPISLTPDAERNDIFKLLPKSIDVFHWHSDTYDLPENTTLLASSKACKNQAFIKENRIVGLQFHLEIYKKTIEELINNNRHDITEGKYVQWEVSMHTASYLTIELNVFMKCILERLDKFNL